MNETSSLKHHSYSTIPIANGADERQSEKISEIDSKLSRAAIVIFLILILLGVSTKKDMTLSKIKAFQQISNNHIFNLSKVDTHSESSDANSLVDKESLSWIWYNDPLEWGYLDNSSDLFVKVPPKSDCWQNSYYPNGKGGYQADNAPFYHTTIEGNFVATVQFSGQYLHLYDQAGIMVRSSSTNWMKCGVEFTSNVQYASTVITRDGFSDWSILAIQPLNPESVVFKVKRIGNTIETFYSLDGISENSFTKIRMGYLTNAPSVQVGLVAAAPSDNDNGFKVVFSNMTIVPLSDEDVAHEQ